MQINIPDNTIQDLKEKLNSRKKIVILTHYNPDGDAIGSALALYNYFLASGHDVAVILPNNAPVYLKWMPGSNEMKIFDDGKKNNIKHIIEADLIFCLDFNDISRVDSMGEYYTQSSAMKIHIDHHPSPTLQADYVFSDTSVSSAAELLWELIVKLAPEPINQDVASCIFVGIYTDTGRFSFNSSSPRTYEIVAELMRYNINKDIITDKIYNTYSQHRMKLMGHCLYNKLTCIPKKNSAYISLSQKDLKEHNFISGDTEGFVNMPLSIKGIVFSTLITENEDVIKFSFRSKGKFDVNKFAREHFNGGGHTNASGGKLKTTLEEAIQFLEDKISEYKSELDYNYGD